MFSAPPASKQKNTTNVLKIRKKKFTSLAPKHIQTTRNEYLYAAIKKKLHKKCSPTCLVAYIYI